MRIVFWVALLFIVTGCTMSLPDPCPGGERDGGIGGTGQCQPVETAE